MNGKVTAGDRFGAVHEKSKTIILEYHCILDDVIAANPAMLRFDFLFFPLKSFYALVAPMKSILDHGSWKYVHTKHAMPRRMLWIKSRCSELMCTFLANSSSVRRLFPNFLQLFSLFPSPRSYAFDCSNFASFLLESPDKFPEFPYNSAYDRPLLSIFHFYPIFVILN